MEQLDLEEEYRFLAQEVKVGSLAEHDFEVTEFFRLYADIASENGDTPDLEYSPILFEGTPKHRVDGYALDLVEGGDGESGDLYLVVCDFYQDESLPNVNAKHVDQAVDYAGRFFNRAQDNDYIEMLEEESPEYQLALLIRQYFSRIKRVRVIVFTNGLLKTRRNVFETRVVGNCNFHINVVDIERYARISNSGSEPIEVDFSGDFGGGVECLAASSGDKTYSAYLFSLSGQVLAEVFSAYKNRLLEQNVRTYLQARTNVNKGILKTIKEEPNMFFAYNNGITATASEVDVKTSLEGKILLNSIKNFQIVNGGQTTASLLYV